MGEGPNVVDGEVERGLVVLIRVIRCRDQRPERVSRVSMGEDGMFVG